MAGYRSPRQRAAMRLAELYRLSDVLQTAGEVLDAPKWLFHLAHTLASAPPGKIGIGTGHKRKPPTWWGLNVEALGYAAEVCQLRASAQQIADVVSRVWAWREKHGAEKVWIRGDRIAKALGITSEIRREAKAWSIGAVDETAAERDARRKRLNKDAKSAKRRECGAPQISESLSRTKPWEPLGMSRATYYRKGLHLNGCVQVENGQARDETTASAANKDSYRAAAVAVSQRDRDAWLERIHAIHEADEVLGILWDARMARMRHLAELYPPPRSFTDHPAGPVTAAA